MPSAADFIGGIQTFFPNQPSSSVPVNTTSLATTISGTAPAATGVNTSVAAPTLAVAGTTQASNADVSPLKLNTDTLILIGVILSIIVAVRSTK